jgi:hypothetical protein
MEDNYSLLIRKIDEFIRKYYKNRLLRGALYSLAALALFFILVNVLEYFSWFNTATRTVIFYTYLAVAIFIIGKLILVPLLKFRKIGKVITHEQAAEVIGTHFGEVKDILLNTLQLHKLSDENNVSRELIEASIDQKILKLKPVPFSNAIDLKQNRKYLKYALPPALIIFATLGIAPSLVTAPAKRIIYHNTTFEKPAPFSIEILNDKLTAVQQEDFTLKIKINGDEVPDELLIKSGDAVYRMEKENTVRFRYTFRNIQRKINFSFLSGDFISKEYTLDVLPKPIILSFDIDAVYPAYTGHKSEKLSNTGDVTVPAGTKLTWKFYLRDAREVFFNLNGSKHELSPQKSNVAEFSAQLLESAPYSIRVANEYFKDPDSLQFTVNVIPDLYPNIAVEEFHDSVYDNRLYFKGNIKDDYGFSKLAFCYSLKKASATDDGQKPQIKEITFDKSSLQQPFYYFMDVATLNLSPGDVIEYFFEVWDNDVINNYKSTRSQKNIFRIPTLDEIEKKTEEKNADIKDRMEQAILQSQKLQFQIENMNKKLIDKEELGWQEKQQLQQMIQKQQGLQQEIQNIQKENKEKALQELQYKELNPEILEKQLKLEELFNQILPDDVKKMYEELQKLLEQVDKEKVQDMLENMKMNNDDLEKQLDRNLEMFKQLEFAQKLQDAIDKVNKLSEEQKKVSDETGNANKDELDGIKEKQSDLNKQFDNIRNDLNDLQKLNSELSDPNKLENTDDLEQEIEQEMSESKDQLENNNGKNASKSQKSASEKLQKLGDKLQSMQQDIEEENAAEDIETLRQILENLVDISFGQEDLMNMLNVIGVNNPKYVQTIQDQKNLQDDLRMVEDSLMQLSKRQSAIQPFVMREISAIDNNMGETIGALNDRTVSTAKSKQQYIMTSVNNLALMLAESMKEMQSNMPMGGSGKSKSQCNNPKAGQGKSGKMNSLRQLQDQLNKQLGEMKSNMDKSGNKQGQQGNRQMSEQLARMAAQQEAIRKQLQEIGEEMQNQGTGMDKGIKQMMQQMEQTETDIVNKRITRETLLRQQDIVTRLLESEKAEQQRELDQQRESKEGQDKNYGNPATFFEFNKLKEKETEMIRVVPPTLKPFYKKKANAYFLSFE